MLCCTYTVLIQSLLPGSPLCPTSLPPLCPSPPFVCPPPSTPPVAPPPVHQLCQGQCCSGCGGLLPAARLEHLLHRGRRAGYRLRCPQRRGGRSPRCGGYQQGLWILCTCLSPLGVGVWEVLPQGHPWCRSGASLCSRWEVLSAPMLPLPPPSPPPVGDHTAGRSHSQPAAQVRRGRAGEGGGVDSEPLHIAGECVYIRDSALIGLFCIKRSVMINESVETPRKHFLVIGSTLSSVALLALPALPQPEPDSEPVRRSLPGGRRRCRHPRPRCSLDTLSPNPPRW